MNEVDFNGKPVGSRGYGDDAAVRNAFYNWLVAHGYSEVTPSGNKSTVYDYMKRIDRVAEREGTTVSAMAANPIPFSDKYEIGGSEEAFGAKSHNAYRAALRCFAECFGRE